ncbi:MAG: RagB/SusD family nutrient uptake outer membrane protein [Flavobacterium sp.]|nr:RagB/SusD family nutrient uptake outer membrane protein [Flavobacterium sp.]
MKKLQLYLLAIFFVTVSCSDELNVEPNDAMSEFDFLNNPDNAIQLVNGVYNKLLDWNMNSFAWIGVTSITSDDADKGSTPGDTGTDKHKLDALNFESNLLSFKDVWDARYDGIYRANNAIYYLERLTIDQNLKNRLIGEAKFLRALWYFDLVRCFGGVPLVTSKIEITDIETVNAVVYNRKSKAETYAQIEADLLDAIEKLPTKSQYVQSDLGRASKGAAQALLAKSYLYQEEWQKAFDTSELVLNSGTYGLMPNYADVWKEIGENGIESIFEVQATLSKGIVGYTDVQGPRGTPDLGWGFNTPSASLANAYSAGDLRKNATILFVQSSPFSLWDGFEGSSTWNNSRYNYKAYQSSIVESWNGNKGETAKNLRILKFSDVVLIRAEAALQLGNSSEALVQVNRLRTRAGLSELTSISLDQLYEERHLEMAMEHDRWFDLVRTRQAQTKMAQNGKTFIVGKHELFPIPIDLITQSGGLLQQNPGY